MVLWDGYIDCKMQIEGKLWRDKVETNTTAPPSGPTIVGSLE